MWVSSSEVDVIPSEMRQANIVINAYIRNPEKWYWWTYLQGRNRDSDIENRLLDAVRQREGGMNWETGTEIYSLLYVK